MPSQASIQVEVRDMLREGSGRIPDPTDTEGKNAFILFVVVLSTSRCRNVDPSATEGMSENISFIVGVEIGMLRNVKSRNADCAGGLGEYV